MGIESNTKHPRPIKVLIIEDDSAMLFLFQQILLMNHFDVLATRSGAEGFRLASKDKPDVILIDLSLSDTDGLALLNRLKANKDTAGIPTLATTAHWMCFGEEYFVTRGFNGLIKQPIDLKGLGDTMRSMAVSNPSLSANMS
jgi:response regulator RpfG family c-di-GMP phosphodiesterase